MNGSFGLWRRKIWIWFPPALALILATLYLAYFQRGLRSQGANLERRLLSAEREHEEAGNDLNRLETLAAQALATREQTARLKEEKFATESGRFTSLVREIKQLAEHAGLDPREIGYPEESYASLGLVRRSFVFGVQGSYVNLRAFLYLLELSPSYVTIDQIELRDLSGAKGLGVNLRLSTFFAAPAAEPPSRTTAGGSS